MLSTFISDSILRETECGECLKGRKDNSMWEVRQLVVFLTLFDCNASARCWAPSSPISFSFRSSVVSVWGAESTMVCERWDQSLFVSLQSIVIPEPNVEHLHTRFDSYPDRVWWLSEAEKREQYVRRDKSLFVSHYSTVMPQPDVEHLHLRFHSQRDRLWWVSQKEKRE